MQGERVEGGGRLVARDEMGPFEGDVGAVDVGMCVMRYGEVASVWLYIF